MISRLKVIAAAEALHEFTIPELATYSGLPPKTVNTVVRREDTLFEAAIDETTGERKRSNGPGGRGRPAVLWRIRDEDKVRDVLSDLRDDESDLLRPLREEFSPYGTGARVQERYNIDALSMAETKYLEAAAETEDMQRRTLLLRTARHYVEPLLQPDPESNDRDGTLRRARLVDEMAESMMAETNGDTGLVADKADRLIRTSNSLGQAASTLPGAVLISYWRAVTVQAEAVHHLPPMQFLMRADEPVPEIFPALADVDWSTSQADEGHVTWFPEWARGLAVAGLVFTVVYQSRPEHDDWRGDLDRWITVNHGVGPGSVVVAEAPEDIDFRVATETGYQLLRTDWGISSVLNVCHAQLMTSWEYCTPLMGSETSLGWLPLLTRNPSQSLEGQAGGLATVQWFDQTRGYGMLRTDTGLEAYFDSDIIEGSHALLSTTRVQVTTRGRVPTSLRLLGGEDRRLQPPVPRVATKRKKAYLIGADRPEEVLPKRKRKR